MTRKEIDLTRNKSRSVPTEEEYKVRFRVSPEGTGR